MPLVLDLRIAHDRFGSSSDPSINGHLHYPNDIDRSLNETVTDKMRKYHADYNNNPPSSVAFMPTIASTSGRLHSEFVLLLFLQGHRETDHFFAGHRVDWLPHEYVPSGLGTPSERRRLFCPWVFLKDHVVMYLNMRFYFEQ